MRPRRPRSPRRSRVRPVSPHAQGCSATPRRSRGQHGRKPAASCHRRPASSRRRLPCRGESCRTLEFDCGRRCGFPSAPRGISDPAAPRPRWNKDRRRFPRRSSAGRQQRHARAARVRGPMVTSGPTTQNGPISALVVDTRRGGDLRGRVNFHRAAAARRRAGRRWRTSTRPRPPSDLHESPALHLDRAGAPAQKCPAPGAVDRPASPESGNGIRRSKQRAPPLCSPVGDAAKRQNSAALRHRLHDQHPGHHGKTGEMPLEEMFVRRDVLKSHHPLFVDLHNAVDQQQSGSGAAECL